MAELTDPPSGKPLVLRVEISAEGGELSVPALEAGLRAGSGHTVSEKIRLASREKRVAQIEEELDGRLREVDEREDALEAREAEFEADVELREQRIERWRAELSELEQRLDRKETELTLYVGELQGELSKREPGWWPIADRPLRHH